MPVRPFALTPLVLFCGCNVNIFRSDTEALDRYSHAYTAFEDASDEAELMLNVIAAEVDPFGFWEEFRGALDTRADNSSRLTHAELAKSLYDSRLSHAAHKTAEAIGYMDRMVGELIEGANALRTPEYRTDAVEGAKRARDVQTGFSEIHRLWTRRFDLQIKAIDEIIKDGGQMRGGPSFSLGAKKV